MTGATTQAAEGAPPMDLRRLLHTCIHCGLCLSACPTYVATGDEAESPRGRLLLMLERMSADPPSSSTVRLVGGDFDRGPLDRCLGCRNCETVCPSGVQYGHLLEEARTQLGPPTQGRGRLVAWLIDHVLAHPRRTYVAAQLGRLARRSKLVAVLPATARELLHALPVTAPTRRPALALPSQGDVALLAGCAQRVFTPEALEATVKLVRACGATPYLPAGQGCCGALSHHLGSTAAARAMARRVVDCFQGAAAVVVPSAGCSAHMRAYGQLLRDDPSYAVRAQQVASRTVDLVAWLDSRRDRLRLRPSPRRVVYHPPCHHTHAQRIVDAPLRLLSCVPQLQVAPLRDAERCCGSAGSYNLLQPALAREIRAAKLDAIAHAAGDVVLTANPGCELFLLQGMRERGSRAPVQHLAVFLADLL